jgi:catechol 2,3-dioxygenase-like lactoylglutathione lyase family enzyme
MRGLKLERGGSKRGKRAGRRGGAPGTPARIAERCRAAYPGRMLFGSRNAPMRPTPLLALSAWLVVAAAAAQSPVAAPPSSVTIGFMHAIHATDNVDATLEFYTRVFGVAAKVQPFKNPGVPLLTNSPGVTLRVAMLHWPGDGFNFELTEFSNVKRTPAEPSIVDPGAPHMKVLVHDLKPVLAGLDAVHATIVTRSSEPVRVKTARGEVKAIFFRDPDGYLVEAIEVQDGDSAVQSGNVRGSIMGLTVADMDQSLKFWRDQLGFSFEKPSEFSSDPSMLDLYGVKGRISFRTVHGVVPGSTARIELIEFRGVLRQPFDLRVPDPGASGMAIRVAAIGSLLTKLKAAGVRVLSKDGALVNWSPTIRNVFVKDPNGLNIELVGDASSAQ